MKWREMLLIHFGPGYFPGTTFGDWTSLLRENRFSISPFYTIRASLILLQTVPNTFLRWIETVRYSKQWSRVSIPPPLFILGHYRHGTTHLQNLFSIDRRFAFPNMYQVSYLHTFLTTERFNAKFIDFFVPRSRPADKVRLGADVP